MIAMCSDSVPTPDRDHVADLITRNLLIGAMPSSGKSFPLKQAAAIAALTGEQNGTGSVLAAQTEED